MRWLWFVASLICFAVVFRTPSMGLAILCLVGALVFMLVGVVVMVSARIDSRTRDVSAMMSPEDIRRARELDAKRRASANAAGSPQAGTAEMGVTPMFVGGAAAAGTGKRSPHHDSDARDGDASDGGSDGGDGGGGGD